MGAYWYLLFRKLFNAHIDRHELNDQMTDEWRQILFLLFFAMFYVYIGIHLHYALL